MIAYFVLVEMNKKLDTTILNFFTGRSVEFLNEDAYQKCNIMILSV